MRFYRKRALRLWGRKEPCERADELQEHVFAHLEKQDGDQERVLYRVFYYDYRPVDKKYEKDPETRKIRLRVLFR